MTNKRNLAIQLSEAQNWRCAYCGCAMRHPDEKISAWSATIDHVQATSRRGSNDWSNLVAACHSCNQAKTKMDAREFLHIRQRLLADGIWPSGHRLNGYVLSGMKRQHKDMLRRLHQQQQTALARLKSRISHTAPAPFLRTPLWPALTGAMAATAALLCALAAVITGHGVDALLHLSGAGIILLSVVAFSRRIMSKGLLP